MPTREDLQTARTIVAKSPDASANLALLGDKHLLFNKDRTALIMYGVKGRSWVSLGGPVGEPKAVQELAADFCELCDAGGGRPVFYKVDENQVSMYEKIGLTLVKLGEEGRVPLADFGGSTGDPNGTCTKRTVIYWKVVVRLKLLGRTLTTS